MSGKKKAKTKNCGREPKSDDTLSSAERRRLKDERFAFKKQRKEPINDASHVRNAISRFDQVEGVTDAERDKAWKRIRKAANKFGVEVSERSWRELGRS